MGPQSGIGNTRDQTGRPARAHHVRVARQDGVATGDVFRSSAARKRTFLRLLDCTKADAAASGESGGESGHRSSSADSRVSHLASGWRNAALIASSSISTSRRAWHGSRRTLLQRVLCCVLSVGMLFGQGADGAGGQQALGFRPRGGKAQVANMSSYTCIQNIARFESRQDGRRESA